MKINRIITLLVCLISVSIIPSCPGQEKYGQSFEPKNIVPIASIVNGDSSQIGKTVEVQGRITRVCATMQCWFFMVDKSGPPLFIDLELNQRFTADVSKGDEVIVMGRIKKMKNSNKLAISADGIIIK